MKNEWKIPFKKLEWHSGVTDLGVSQGYVYQIGEFYEYNNSRSPLRKYYITNHREKPDKLSVWSSEDDKSLGEVSKLDEGKELCQIDFESYIMKTFFETDGRAV
jgi:hypothetical protein